MADEQKKTGISAGNGGEMGDDGHVAPGGEMASMPGGPPKTRKSEHPDGQQKDQEKPKEKKAS